MNNVATAAAAATECRGKGLVGISRGVLVCHRCSMQPFVCAFCVRMWSWDQIKSSFEAAALKNKVARMWESDTCFLDGETCEMPSAWWEDSQISLIVTSLYLIWRYYEPLTQCCVSLVMEHSRRNYNQQSEIINSLNSFPLLKRDKRLRGRFHFVTSQRYTSRFNIIPPNNVSSWIFFFIFQEQSKNEMCLA